MIGTGVSLETQSCYVEIGNEYLGKYRRITGHTHREVEFKACEQLLRRAQKEERTRELVAIGPYPRR